MKSIHDRICMSCRMAKAVTTRLSGSGKKQHVCQDCKDRTGKKTFGGSKK